MISNKDITLVNEYQGKYYGFFIPGVSFIGKVERTATEKGLNSANYFVCRIPENAVNGEYVTSKSWPFLSLPPIIYLTTENGVIIMDEDGEAVQTENVGKWTLRPQKTYVVIGAVSFKELNNFTALMKEREVYTVVTAKDNRLGYPFVNHWRFACK